QSSLLNALAGYQRTIVAPPPGTTRDVGTPLLAIDGWPVELADTAGLRASDESLEGFGVAKARQSAAAADLCLWVLDASTAPVWPDVDSRNVHLVVNKMDLEPAWDLKQAAVGSNVSAQTRQGLGELCQVISMRLVPDPPPPGVAVPFTPSLS